MFVAFICVHVLLLFSLSWSREFGLFFQEEEAYLQVGYLTLCDEGAIKFEVLINSSSGVVMYAENKVKSVNMILYFERPGMYINVTDGALKYNLPLTLDFFSNQWFGWHEIEVRLTEYKIHLVFDNTQRHVVLQGRHLFPEDLVEENDIYFGAIPSWTGVGNVTRFSGFMKNIKYRSCGCEEWRPIKILRSVKVTMEYLGDCGPVNACIKDCTCYLFPWGGKRCDCPREACSQSSDSLTFTFDREDSGLRRLHTLNSTLWIASVKGPGGNGMEISEKNSLILYVAKGRSCFRNIFLCENGVSYSFWILPTVNKRMNDPVLVLKHSTTLDSTHGLTVTRSMDLIHVSLTTREGFTFNVRSPMTLSVWSLITIAYNHSHLSIYVNSHLYQSSARFTKTDQVLSNVLSTRFMFIGNHISYPSVTISNLQFSADLSFGDLSSVQELRLEQHQDVKKTNVECYIDVKDGLTDLSSCYQRVFNYSKFTDFYISLIFNISCDKRTIIIQSSFISVEIVPSNIVELSVLGQLTKPIKLSGSFDQLKYIEISMNIGGELVVVQNMDQLLLNTTLNIDMQQDLSKVLHIQVNNDCNVLSVVRILNTNKHFGARLLRILTKRISQYSVDFDDEDNEQHKSLRLIDGYIGRGLLLSYPSLHIAVNWFNGSCIQYLASCYHGLTVSFLVKFYKQFKDDNGKRFQIFSSGNNGISLLIDTGGRYFLLVTESGSVTKFISRSAILSLGKWNLFEITVSQNKVPSLYINREETQRVKYISSSYTILCKHLCLGDEQNIDSVVTIMIDQIYVWDVERLFLYANGYLTKGPSEHKLISFTNYQLQRSFTMNGSAKIISTKYGYALALNNFGSRSAIINMTDEPICFWNLDHCRRGIVIRIWLRPDNLAISHQILLSSPSITVGINLEYLTIQIRALGQSWFMISKDLLQLFTWQVIDVSWHPNDGLKTYINGRLTGHSKNGGKHSPTTTPRQTPTLFVGTDYVNTGNINYATVLIDDIELFDGDRTNLAYESHHVDDLPCVLHFNFDDNTKMAVQPLLGIVGSAGLFKDRQESPVRIEIPKCFDNRITGCKICFALRLWLNIHKLNVTVLSSGFVTLSVGFKEIKVDIGDVTSGQLLKFFCQYDESGLLHKWNFIEISWDLDEGLLLFVNRDGILCHLNSVDKRSGTIFDAINISKEFVGAIDEIEMYHSRLSALYWSKTVDESAILSIIEKIREKEKVRQEVALLKSALNSASVNRSVEIVDSVQFNGSNYVSYKLPKNAYSYIPGGREEVEISFKSFNSLQSSIIWISDSLLSKNTLTLKNKKLFFTKVYILTSSNTSKRLTEEIEIHDNILPNMLYNVVIYQRAGEIVMKTTSLNESNIQSMIGREPLLPMDGDIYFGGYNNTKFLRSNQINSSLSGIIYKARLKAGSNEKEVDIIQEMAAAKSNPNIANHGNVLVLKKTINPNTHQKTSFLATLSYREIPLMINSPFFSLRLPKWDFSLLTSVEIEFSTFESRGQLLFIGNLTDFISLEIFDSELFFNYKYNGIFRKIKTHGDLIKVDNNKAHRVYIGRDLSGNIKVYYNRDEMMDSAMKFGEVENTVSMIGHLGIYDRWPREIMSRMSFVGCIHFVRINDADYVDFTKNSELIKYQQVNLYPQQMSHISAAFKSGTCAISSLTSCEYSPCTGGWCQLTTNSITGQLSDNFKCNCLYSSKSLALTFSGNSSLNNFNIWVYQYLLQFRSQACSKDTKQLSIVDQSSFVVNLQMTFPFTSVLDLEFLVLLRSRHTCIMELTLEHSTMFIINSDGHFLINITEHNIVSIADVNMNDGQWHGIHVQVRLQSVRVTIGNLQKEFTSSLIPDLVVSFIKVGDCAGYRQSNFKIKGLSYNGLNVLSTLDHVPIFYSVKYNYPTIKELDKSARSSVTRYPITLLNNFQHAVTIQPIKLSWFTQFHLSLKSTYPGVIFHIFNGPKTLSSVLCRNNVMLFIHRDNFMKLKVERVTVYNDPMKFTLTFDLIKETLRLKNFRSDEYQLLGLGIDSWSIGDSVNVKFGVNKFDNGVIDFSGLEKEDRECLKDSLNSSMIGCVESLVWSDGNNSISFTKEWTNILKTTPRGSIISGICKVVERCNAQTCLNGVCTSLDNAISQCDCSDTEFIGNRCEIVRDKCSQFLCHHNGRCVSAKDYNGLDTAYCNCSGTGYMGRHCEDIVCREDFCFNKGKCYTIANVLTCDCNSTNYTGSKCDIPFCRSSTCNRHGSCQIIANVNSPLCHCHLGFFGNYCDQNYASKCQTVCKNDGVCSIYTPIFKLCSNQYCQQLDSFECDCDHTLYRGTMCEQAEFGFHSLKDGVVLMENVTVTKRNYLRILFEVANKQSKATLISIMKSANRRMTLHLVDEDLVLKNSNSLGHVYFAKILGKVVTKNVLLLTEGDSEVDFYFNSRIGNIQFRDSELKLSERIKRDVPVKDLSYPALIIGCNKDMINCFDGLIAGIKWNDRRLMDKSNTFFKNRQRQPIENLRTRPFPTPISFLMLNETTDGQYVAIAVVSVLVLILFTFVVARKLWCRSVLVKKVYLNGGNGTMSEIALIERKELKLDLAVPDSSPELSSQGNYESRLTVKSISSSASSELECCRILLITDVDAVNRFNIVDYTTVPGNYIVIVVNYLPEIKISQNLFPLDADDILYKCVEINISPRGHYIYCHMASLQTAANDDLEIQVWKITEPFELLTRPPNIQFTHSVPFADDSYKIILFNNNTYTLSLFEVEFSTVLWTNCFTNPSPVLIEPLILVDKSLKLIVNRELYFEIFDANDGALHSINEVPLNAGCRQIIEADYDKLILLSGNFDLYHWDMRSDFYNHKQLPKQTKILARAINRSSNNIALGMETGEVYLSLDHDGLEYMVLGPQNDKKIMCLAFSFDGALLAAAFENNLVHVWRLETGLPLCHFHAVHERGEVLDLDFTSDNRRLIVVVVTSNRVRARNNKKLLIIDTNNSSK